MVATVILPWRGGCEHRSAALAWTLDQYAVACPGWDVTIAEAPAGPWVKAAAVMPAIADARDGLVIVADADVWSDATPAAAAAVAAGWPWAIPHRRVHRLTQDATADVLAGAAPTALSPTTQRPYRGTPGGGIVIARRQTLLDIPLDPRFVGWGGEDHAWGHALTCLAGPAWRTSAPLFHLWHPPQPRLTRRVGSHENAALTARYAAARSNPSALRALVERPAA